MLPTGCQEGKLLVGSNNGYCGGSVTVVAVSL